MTYDPQNPIDRPPQIPPQPLHLNYSTPPQNTRSVGMTILMTFFKVIVIILAILGGLVIFLLGMCYLGR
jgi:hypothetical protein